MSDTKIEIEIDIEQPNRSHSPVQEQHIDFLLEEEFSSNPDFIKFFIDNASGKSVPQAGGSKKTLPLPDEQWDCHAVRSVTTDLGETDVLVIYRSLGPNLKRVAILIEDKIRAGFQDKQPGRYTERGKAGLQAKQWDSFWTCLVAPERYAPKNTDFDTRVNLESIRQFFAGTGHRDQFKAGVINRAIQVSGMSGVKNVDPTVTEFRTFYADQAEHYFPEHDGDIRWDKPRDAWYGDTWFVFKSDLLPRGAVITHKASAGVVHLSFPQNSVTRLYPVLENGFHGSQITAVQTNKSASFALPVTPITAFENREGSILAIEEAFRAVSELMKFWKQNHEVIIHQLDSASS